MSLFRLSFAGISVMHCYLSAAPVPALLKAGSFKYLPRSLKADAPQGSHRPPLSPFPAPSRAPCRRSYVTFGRRRAVVGQSTPVARPAGSPGPPRPSVASATARRRRRAIVVDAAAISAADPARGSRDDVADAPSAMGTSPYVADH